MSDVMMKALQLQVESLTRQVERLGPENERVRKLLTEFDQRHDTDQNQIATLSAKLEAAEAERLWVEGEYSNASRKLLEVANKYFELESRAEAAKAERDALRDAIDATLDKLNRDGMKPGWGVVRDWLNAARQKGGEG